MRMCRSRDGVLPRLIFCRVVTHEALESRVRSHNCYHRSHGHCPTARLCSGSGSQPVAKSHWEEEEEVFITSGNWRK